MKTKLCVLCHYARMREDICGIYCTGGFVEKDGTCRHFVPVEEDKGEDHSSFPDCIEKNEEVEL